MAQPANGSDGKASFQAEAGRNRTKVERAITRSMGVGKTQVPAHDARALLELIRKGDRTISSDSAHLSLVASIVSGHGWTYKPKSAKK